jgi:hypothetical protein
VFEDDFLQDDDVDDEVDDEEEAALTLALATMPSLSVVSVTLISLGNCRLQLTSRTFLLVILLLLEHRLGLRLRLLVSQSAATSSTTGCRFFSNSLVVAAFRFIISQKNINLTYFCCCCCCCCSLFLLF